MASPRVVVLADDLIWADRLARLLDHLGARPARAKTAPELDRELACADAVVIDLTARNYDPVAAIQRAAQMGHPILAIGQHDDVALRKRALAAGADRVLAYRKLSDDGPETLRSWLDRAGLAARSPR